VNSRNEVKGYEMKNERSSQSAYQQGGAPRLKPTDPQTFRGRTAAALAVFLLGGGIAAAQGNSAVQLRQFIGQQVGGINNLTVPATNAAIPVPTLDFATLNWPTSILQTGPL
jgi:hypothetical protein